METEGNGLRRVVGLVALVNLAYFAVEFTVAVGIGSVSLQNSSQHPLLLCGMKPTVLALQEQMPEH